MEPSYIYVNCNSVAGNQAQSPAAVFTEQRVAPLVNKASDFDLAIVRATFVGLEVPLAIAQIQVGQPNASLCTWAVLTGLNYTDEEGGVDFTSVQNVIWYPEYAAEQMPEAPQTQMFLTSRFYWAKSHGHILRLFEAAFLSARNDLQNQLNAWFIVNRPGMDPYVLQATPPRIVYNAGTGFTFAFDMDSYGKREFYQFALNEPAQVLFSGTPFFQIAPYNGNSSTIPIGTYYLIDTKDTGQTITLEGQVLRAIPQERNSSDAWAAVESIVVSTTLNIVSQAECSVNNLGLGDGFLTLNNNFQTVITDIQSVNTAGDYQGVLQYSPEMPRYCQLLSNDGLSTLTFYVFWRCRHNGQLIQATLAPTGSVNLKLLLRRRY